MPALVLVGSLVADLNATARMTDAVGVRAGSAPACKGPSSWLPAEQILPR